MLGAWSQAAELVEGEPIPVSVQSLDSYSLGLNGILQTWYFARDDRVYKVFLDKLVLHNGAIQRKCSRRLRWQFRVLAKVLEGRNTTYRVRTPFCCC